MKKPLPSWKAMSEDDCAAFITKQMLAGNSFGDMAAMFADTTRNAILGKKHRLEAKGHMFPASNPRGGMRPPKVATGPAPEPKKKFVPPAKPAPPLPKIKAPVEVQIRTPVEVELAPDTRISREKAFLPLEGITPIALIDIPHRARCRWPVDVPGELHFACGAQTITDEHPYCATHRRISIEGAKPQGAH